MTKMPKKGEGKILSEHLLEIRYPAFGEFFDIRGSLAEMLRRDMKFTDWEIARNRIQVRNHSEKEKATESAFISFVNCGYRIARPATKNYFQDITSKFVRLAFSASAFNVQKIRRLGVRSMFLTPIDADFETLKEQCREKIFKGGDLLSEKLTAKLVDLNVILNFKKGDYFFNTMIGPMEKDQMKQYFDYHQDLPELGLYFDIDYFQKDLKPDVRNMTHCIADFETYAWEKLQIVQSFILE